VRDSLINTYRQLLRAYLVRVNETYYDSGGRYSHDLVFDSADVVDELIEALDAFYIDYFESFGAPITIEVLDSVLTFAVRFYTLHLRRLSLKVH